jgi:hypothetical protein
MRTKLFHVVIGFLSFSLLFGTTPANAKKIPVIDFCANKSTGKVRAIIKGSCSKSELSLGVGPILRGETRPSALIPQFKSRYEAAKAAGSQKGYKLSITSGYRTVAQQKILFQNAIKRNGSVKEATKWVLPPEKSNHPWGIAIDVNYRVSGSKGNKAAAWLEKNGYKYGLCRRYKNEWWHFEPLVSPGQLCPKMEPYAS